MWIHDRFFAQASRQPQRTAIVYGQERLTYGELADLAERIACRLARLLPRQSRVALHMHKSPLMIAMMLGCLRAGLAYVPIDPKSPIERRNLIVEDSGAALVATDERTAAEWAKHPAAFSTLRYRISPLPDPESNADLILWEELLQAQEQEPMRELGRTEADEMAYLLYTSGSTGVPKAVVITQANAAAFVDWGCAAFDIGPDDRVAVHAPLHFDLPVFDLYVGLGQGATLYPIDERSALFPEALFRLLRDERVTVLYAVPSALIALRNRSGLQKEPLPALRYLLYAGEEFHPTPLRELVERLPHARVFNLYGPIETNVVTQFEVRPEHWDLPRIPLGYPIFNARVLLRNEDGQAVDVGEGELVVSGPSVTPGYLHRPELTAATRCELEVDGQVLTGYRTGDYARRDEAGLLHFLGRRDGLVKTRGFRVDLGDVEAALLKHEAVLEAAVVAVPHPAYTNLLFGFVVLQEEQGVSEREMRQFLLNRLPPYMCPQAIEVRSELPKTSTGKIARRPLQDELERVQSSEEGANRFV